MLYTGDMSSSGLLKPIDDDNDELWDLVDGIK